MARKGESAAAREHRLAHDRAYNLRPDVKAKLLVYSRSYLGTPKRLVHQARLRAKGRGTLCTINAAYIESIWPANSLCPHCGERMQPLTPRAPSLDEVVPSLGYIPGNVDVICRTCNTQKGATPPGLLRSFANRIDAVMGNLNGK